MLQSTRVQVVKERFQNVACGCGAGFKFTNQYNMYAPAGTPRGIINAINRVVKQLNLKIE